MADMIEVVIDSVRVNLMSPQRVVVLRQAGADRYLPIWVGPYEAEAITVALQEVEMIRPLTHDLLKNVFTTFNAKIKRIEIVSLQEDIFYGNIVAEVDGQEINVDLAALGCHRPGSARPCADPGPRERDGRQPASSPNRT